MAIVHLGSVDAANKLTPENIVNRLNTLRDTVQTATGDNNPAAALAVLYAKVALDSHIKSWQQQAVGLTDNSVAAINTALKAFAEAYNARPAADNGWVANDAIARLYNTNFMGYTSITPPTPEPSPEGSPVRVGKPDDFRGWDNTQPNRLVGLVPNPVGQNSAPTYTLHHWGEGYNPLRDGLVLPVLTQPASPEGSPQGFPDELFAS